MALPAARRRTPAALTASAVRVRGGVSSDSEYARRWALPWQERALASIDLVPELAFCSRFYAKMMTQLRIFPAIRDEHDNLTPITSGPPVDELERIQDPGGGRSQVQGSYGTLKFTTGEGYLFGRDLQSDEERWSFVWLNELIVSDGEIIWRPNDQVQPRTYREGVEAVAYRMWTPHPRRSGEADSPIRSVIEGGIAEELIILTKAVRSTAVSRMTNGALVMPQELSPGAITGGSDEDPENDPFLADWIDHATAQVENPGTAEAALPWLVWAGYDYLDRIRWMSTHDPQTDYMEQGLRKEAVERIARGLDLPPEILLGMGQANHWSARQIQDEMWRSYGAVVAEQWCDDLTEAYLRPALRDSGYEDWRRVVIGYDASKIVVKPDRSDDVIAAHDRLVISDEAMRRELNFKDSDEPDEDEYQKRAAIKMRATDLIPADDLVPTRGPSKADATPPADAAEGPAQPGPNGATRQDGMSAQLFGAAQLAVIRCRELAGAKLRRYERECPECFKPADGQSNALVAALLGTETLAQLGVGDPLRLVKGGSEPLRILLDAWGYTDIQARLLCTMIETHAAKTLTTASVSVPDDFMVAVTSQVREVAA